MENANIKVKVYSEIQKVFQETHEANFKDSKLIGGDILKVKDEDIKKWTNKLDIVFAGFPCQSFFKCWKERSKMN